MGVKENNSKKGERINVRIHGDIKQKSESVLKSLNLNMTDAIGLFLNQVILTKSIPFSITNTSTDEQDRDEVVHM